MAKTARDVMTGGAECIGERETVARPRANSLSSTSAPCRSAARTTAGKAGLRHSLPPCGRPRVVVDDVRAIAGRIVAYATSEPVDLAAVVGWLLHTSALDLASVVGDDHP